MITGRQIREARALLGLSRSVLAAKVKVVTAATIMRAESVDDEAPITIAQAAAIQRTLEAAGSSSSLRTVAVPASVSEIASHDLRL